MKRLLSFIRDIDDCALLSSNHSTTFSQIIKINSINNCKCGRQGTAFQFIGRINKSESRGCSDTYED